MSGLRSTASWGARLGLLASGLVASILIVEIFIRVWAVTVATRAEEDAPSDGHLVVLCIGDSHTWGRGHGYPQRMAARLAERSARYRIVNLGVPGTNTAQLRRRLPEQIDRYDPQLIVVWSGSTTHGIEPTRTSDPVGVPCPGGNGSWTTPGSFASFASGDTSTFSSSSSPTRAPTCRRAPNPGARRAGRRSNALSRADPTSTSTGRARRSTTTRWSR